jgi:hypothetical protein
MKRYAEVLCRTYATKIANPMSCVVVRPSNVYGPGDKFDPKTSHVTASIIRRVAEREDPLAMWGTGEDIRDLIYIDDFMDGLVADRINAISDKLQVEIGTKLFEVGPNRYQTGPAYSGGSTHQVNLAKAAGVAGGVEVGTIHTHPHNSPIDPGDRYATYRRSELNGGRDQIGYVSDVNGHLFSWNTAVIAQHPEFGALYENYVWQNYSYGRFDQQVR